MALVVVVMGSESDLPFMQNTLDTLAEMGVEHETLVLSAHRNPEAVREFGLQARSRGIEVIIASWTTLPVIGVPLPTSDLSGLDALYAIVQMPAGIPVATVAIGKAGARNAAYLAAQILGLKFDRIREAYEVHRARLAAPKKA
jgi:5-(carboxyamino)imidazole ribonucleotide mutase